MLKTTFRAELGAALDRGFQLARHRCAVQVGVERVELVFADPAERAAFSGSFRAAPDGHTAMQIAVLVGGDINLERLIPHPRDGYHTHVNGSIYVNWQPSPGEILQLYDAETRRGLLWLPTGQALETVRSRPALPLIHAHLATSEWAPAHAAAVGQGERFLLLAGGSGAGKSTAAVACAAAGWRYAGDDFVLVHPDHKLVEPIYASARLRPGAAALLQDFVARTQVAVTDYFGDPRNELRLGSGHADVPIGGGSVAAILLPMRSGAAGISFRPAKPSETFIAMVSVTLLQLPGFRDALIQKLLRLMKDVPAYAVDTGANPAAIPAAFEQFLAAR